MKGKIVENGIQNLPLFPQRYLCCPLLRLWNLKTKCYNNSLLIEKTFRSGEDRCAQLSLGGKWWDGEQWEIRKGNVEYSECDFQVWSVWKVLFFTISKKSLEHNSEILNLDLN